MSTENKQWNDFLGGIRDLSDVFDVDDLKPEEAEFLGAYKKIIRDHADRGVSGFDPLKKVKDHSRINKFRIIKTVYSWAAVVIFAFLIGFLIIRKPLITPRISTLDKERLEIANRNTVYALNTMAKKLNSGLRQLYQMEELGKPFHALQKPVDFEFNNTKNKKHEN